VTSLLYLLNRSLFHVGDNCNVYTTCSDCIEGSKGGVKCGWCMGGTVVYNDTGDSGLHCAGFQDGKPNAFTCSPEFRTVDCTGYVCSWNSSQPTCSLSDQGQYSDKADCTSVCKNAQYAKCNATSKTCSDCKQGDPDCIYTKDTCPTFCNPPPKTYAKCDFTKHVCSTCDPKKDTNCTMTQDECGYKCSFSYGICDPNTGKCNTCDPSTNTTGCVAGCNSTCSLNPPTDDKYSCDWQTYQCAKDANGTITKDQCASWCVEPTYSKCDTTDGKCYSCDPKSDPKCLLPKANCDASCKKAPSFQTIGTWRGNQVNQKFTRGEYSFKFSNDSTVSIHFVDGKTEYQMNANVTEDDFNVAFKFTKVDSNNPLGVKVGDVVKGVFEIKQGWTQHFNFLYIGFGSPNGDAPADLDGAMSGLEFVMLSCASTTTGGTCDFSAITSTIILV